MSNYGEDPFAGLIFRDGKNSGKARCEANWHWSPQQLRDYDLWYAVSGQGEMKLGDRKYVVKPGTCFLFRPGDAPRATQDLQNRLTVIYIHFEVVRIHEGELPVMSDHPYTEVHDIVHFERLLNRVLEIRDRTLPWSEPEFDSLMKLALLELHRSERRPETGLNAKQERVISELIRLIRKHINRRVSHQELADAVQLSPQYVSVLFKKGTGTSIKEFITEERLKRAMHLLTETTLNVSEVAEALGYTNVYLFSKQFKQRYDAPPSHYRMREVSSQPHSAKDS